jgi:gas vesicle protein
MNSGKLLLGILAGIAAGATLGILLAPDKGEVTRKKIITKGEDYAEGLNERISGLMDSISNRVEKTQQQVEELVSKGKSKYDDLKKETKNGAVSS